jgi:hypothetical protein
MRFAYARGVRSALRTGGVLAIKWHPECDTRRGPALRRHPHDSPPVLECLRKMDRLCRLEESDDGDNRVKHDDANHDDNADYNNADYNNATNSTVLVTSSRPMATEGSTQEMQDVGSKEFLPKGFGTRARAKAKSYLETHEKDQTTPHKHGDSRYDNDLFWLSDSFNAQEWLPDLNKTRLVSKLSGQRDATGSTGADTGILLSDSHASGHDFDHDLLRLSNRENYRRNMARCVKFWEHFGFRALRTGEGFLDFGHRISVLSRTQPQQIEERIDFFEAI